MATVPRGCIAKGPTSKALPADSEAAALALALAFPFALDLATGATGDATSDRGGVGRTARRACTGVTSLKLLGDRA